MNRALRASLAVGITAVALFATVAEGENSSSSGGGSETTAVASSQAAPIPIGTAVEVAADWDLKVNSAELDANATMAAANMFNTPKPGSQYVLVNVSVTNNSDQPEPPFTNLKLSLLPPSGVAIDSAFVAGVPGALDTSAQMQPNATATGSVVFEVPSTDVPGSVLLGQSLFTLDTKKDQKFFAIQ